MIKLFTGPALAFAVMVVAWAIANPRMALTLLLLWRTAGRRR